MFFPAMRVRQPLLDIYTHVVPQQALAAQNFVCAEGNNGGAEKRGNAAIGAINEENDRANWKKSNGRHEETRTPDLYRVKLQLT
jgi:hypothetical protein